MKNFKEIESWKNRNYGNKEVNKYISEKMEDLFYTNESNARYYLPLTNRDEEYWEKLLVGVS